MVTRFALKLGDSFRSAEAKREYNRQVFTEIAPRYDFVTRALSFSRDASWKTDLVAALPDKVAPFCLDLACGTGDITALLARKYPAGRIVGVDITERMLAAARSRHLKGNVRFENQDMCRLHLEDSSADIITGGYALRNAPDLSLAIEEIDRVLKPGGTAAFLDFSRSSDERTHRLHYRVLQAWGGMWGLLLHGNHEVYGYIAESLARHPDRETLHGMFREKGFHIVQTQLCLAGFIEILVVRKPLRIAELLT